MAQNGIDCIETFTGKCFDLGNPDPADVDIRDIAHALANICRYTGHPSRFYSVAAHSIWCSEYAKWREQGPRDQFAILMHDAAEAYIGDINHPLKMLLGQRIKDIEEGIQSAICKAFHFEMVDYKREDLTALATEAAVLMPSGGTWWNLPYPKAGTEIWGWGRRCYERRFLACFEALKPQLCRA